MPKLTLKAELESTQKQVVKSETNKNSYLPFLKTKKQNIKNLPMKKVMANKIRSALFSLAGISEKNKIWHSGAPVRQ